MLSLKDKIVVVTGSQGLIGSSIVKVLRDNGALVLSIDINFKSKNKDQYVIDITDEKSVKNGVEIILNEHKRIDGWVNNAYPRTKDWGSKFEDIPTESWRKNIDMHLNGYFICCQIVLEKMKQQGFGSFINMSSIYGFLGPDFNIYKGTKMTTPAAYSAIKGGIINFSKYLASYYGEDQIRVNSVSPGGIFDNQPEIFVKKYCEKVPLNRMGKPSDVAKAVSFLISDDSSYITGHNLVIDGGFSII